MDFDLPSGSTGTLILQSYEARDVLAMNEFVVVERAATELQQKLEDMPAENEMFMRYRVKIWPGKGSKAVDVPGERMRVWLGKDKQSTSGAQDSTSKVDIFVVTVGELSGFMTELSIFQGREGTYRTSGLTARVRLNAPRTEETPEAKKDRETYLLEPLKVLRFFKSATIEGASIGISAQTTQKIKSQGFDGDQFAETFGGMLGAGDRAQKDDLRSVANSWYQRAQTYLEHFISHQAQVFLHPADPTSFLFTIFQHRSLNYIESRDFENALRAANGALALAETTFAYALADFGGPPTDPQGRTGADALRKWQCDRFRAGSERTGGRIRLTDMGRCFYYRGLAEPQVYEPRVGNQADGGRMLGLALAVDDCASGENVPKELLDLDERIMSKDLDDDHTHDQSSDNEDDDDDDDAWEDEI